MTVILHPSAPLGECRVDLTPRKCQKFKPKKGQTFKWTCTALAAKTKAKGAKKPPAPAEGKTLGKGTVQADRWGLVTLRQMRMLKGAQRVVIVRK